MSVYSQFIPGGSGGTTGPGKDGVVICELLIVGGGGNSPNASTAGHASGGSGSGRVRYRTGFRVLTGVAYTVTVGGAGSPSSFGSIIANAGGFGGDPAGVQAGQLPQGDGTGAGSGPGASINSNTSQNRVNVDDGLRETTVGSSVIDFPEVILTRTLSNSTDGGSSTGLSSLTNRASGGGAGAANADPSVSNNAGAGGNGATTPTAGAAGIGITYSITGSPVIYATGGAGATTATDQNGANGAANTGNGGGGAGRATAGTSTGGLGGSGVVILAYPDSYAPATSVTGTYDQPSRPGWRVYRFTGSGSITL